MPAEEEGRSKENDFKMLSGTYIDKRIHELNVLRDGKKIITSQIGIKGLQVYYFPSDSDSKWECQVVKIPDWESPNVAVNQQERRLICSKCIHKPLIVFDLNVDGIINQIEHPFHMEQEGNLCMHSNVKCQLIEDNTLSVLNRDTGVIALIDLRTGKTFAKHEKYKNGESDECWTLSECDYNVRSSYFGVLSNKGNLCLFDIRNSNITVQEECFTSAAGNDALKLKIANRERASFSGTDSNIYVYNVNENKCELAFTHNGHCQKDVCNKGENRINDHIWLPSIGSNFLVSICNNRSLNCWEYNESVAR